MGRKPIYLQKRGIGSTEENAAGCGKCAEVCPNRALELLGHEEKLEDLLTELMKDQDYYRVSQGGVTFSGGEPLLQAEALARTLEECKRMGLHTAVDTAGNVPFLL